MFESLKLRNRNKPLLLLLDRGAPRRSRSWSHHGHDRGADRGAITIVEIVEPSRSRSWSTIPFQTFSKFTVYATKLSMPSYCAQTKFYQCSPSPTIWGSVPGSCDVWPMKKSSGQIKKSIHRENRDQQNRDQQNRDQ